MSKWLTQYRRLVTPYWNTKWSQGKTELWVINRLKDCIDDLRSWRVIVQNCGGTIRYLGTPESMLQHVKCPWISNTLLILTRDITKEEKSLTGKWMGSPSRVRQAKYGYGCVTGNAALYYKEPITVFLALFGKAIVQTVCVRYKSWFTWCTFNVCQTILYGVTDHLSLILFAWNSCLGGVTKTTARWRDLPLTQRGPC